VEHQKYSTVLDSVDELPNLRVFGFVGKPYAPPVSGTDPRSARVGTILGRPVNAAAAGVFSFFLWFFRFIVFFWFFVSFSFFRSYSFLKILNILKI
jgi:hypothetical protein